MSFNAALGKKLKWVKTLNIFIIPVPGSFLSTVIFWCWSSLDYFLISHWPVLTLSSPGVPEWQTPWIPIWDGNTDTLVSIVHRDQESVSPCSWVFVRKEKTSAEFAQVALVTWGETELLNVGVELGIRGSKKNETVDFCGIDVRCASMELLSSEFGQFTATAGSSKFQYMITELQEAIVVLNWPTWVYVKHESVF